MTPAPHEPHQHAHHERSVASLEPAGLPSADRIRVVEVLATGSNGGAQEHLYSLLTRMDRARFETSVVALSPGSAVRKLQRAGIPVLVIDEPDDAIAVGAVAAHLASFRPDVVHNHMYRAELVGTRAAIALGEVGLRRPYVVSTVHSSRVRSAEDREQLRRLTPDMDRLIAVSRAIEAKLEDEGRIGLGTPVDLIYNGVDLERYDHQEPCCTLRDEYGMEPGSQIVGVVARLEPEKGHPTLFEAWPAVPDLTERDGGAGADELGAVHVVVDDVRANVDEVRRESARGDRVVVLIDDEHVEARALQLADGTPRRQRYDRDIETAVVHPADEPEHVFLRAATAPGGEHLDDADAFAGDDRRSRHRLEARVVPEMRAHEWTRRSKRRWIGSSTAPHSYLYDSSPRRKSIRRRPRSSARAT